MVGSGRIEVLTADDLYLYANQRLLRGGDTNRFHVRDGQPGQPVALFIVGVDGTPMSLLLAFSLLDPQGWFDSALFKVPSNVGTHTIELEACALESAKIVKSWTEILDTQ